jgi:hypothetical protein
MTDMRLGYSPSAFLACFAERFIGWEDQQKDKKAGSHVALSDMGLAGF